MVLVAQSGQTRGKIPCLSRGKPWQWLGPPVPSTCLEVIQQPQVPTLGRWGAEGTWCQGVEDTQALKSPCGVASPAPSFSVEVFSRPPLLWPYTHLLSHTDHSQICGSEWKGQTLLHNFTHRAWPMIEPQSVLLS